jgi:hypothetical protein
MHKRKRGDRVSKILVAKTPAGWEVRWHPKALAEREAVGDSGERTAINRVINKLQVDGPALAYPHQSAVMGEKGSGLRELRPRRGHSRWRPIYRRVEGRMFAILAVGPEAGIDKAGYGRAVLIAGQRLGRLEKGKARQ